MNYICTWLCADEVGEESIFYQTGKLSSSPAHQLIYWRCLIVFFITSRRFNDREKHLLFTNVRTLPEVDGRRVADILDDLRVEVIVTDFKYKTPKGYYGAFQNQFYEFSILEHIAARFASPADQVLILDSDCIFLKPADALFAQAARNGGFLSYEDNVMPDYKINGLSRRDMKGIFEELLERKIDGFPGYHYGEFLLCSVENIRRISDDFKILWPELLGRFALGKPRFNEEAHTLSYLYFKNGLQAMKSPVLMKRIWTNPVFYRDAAAADLAMVVWHLPAEKTYGLFRLYRFLLNESADYGFHLGDDTYLANAQQILGVPHLSVWKKVSYYFSSYSRALRKRLNRLAPGLKKAA